MKGVVLLIKQGSVHVGILRWRGTEQRGEGTLEMGAKGKGGGNMDRSAKRRCIGCEGEAMH